MTPHGWEWPVTYNEQQHRERVTLMREIWVHTTSLIDEASAGYRDREEGALTKALSVNISSGGMLLLMEQPLEVERVLRLDVPTPVRNATTPTLAEVRWVRKVPFSDQDGVSFVGVKFLF